MTEQGTLGSYLRALRQERKGSLAEMAHATRVSVSQLEALESDAAAALPAPVFVKGFIRAYEQRMDTLVTHPLFGYRVSYRRVLEIQARLLARLVTGELVRYPGFETR